MYHRRYERGQRTSSDGRRHCPKMPGLDASDRTPALNPVYHTGMSGGPNNGLALEKERERYTQLRVTK
jgi:hypothetical protein